MIASKAIIKSPSVACQMQGELLDLIEVIAIFLDVEGNIRFISRKGSEILGYKSSELVGKNWIETLIPKDFRDKVLVVFRGLLNGELDTYEYYENPVIMAEGKIGYFAWHNSCVRDDQGNIEGVLASGMDISGQREAREQLAKSEKKYRSLFESSYDAIIVQDFKSNILDVNSQAANIQEKIVKRIAQAVTALFAEGDYIDLSTDEPTGTFKRNAISFDLKIPIAESTINYFNISSRILDVKSGTIQTIIRDISDNKMTENALKESEQKLKNIVDNVGVGISVISPKMEILSLNKQMRLWFPRIDTTLKPICYEAFNAPPRAGICEYCPTAITLRDGERHESISETPAGGEIRQYRIISTPIKNAAGEVVYAVEMVEDITEQKRQEDFRKERNEFLRNLVGQEDASKVAALAFDYVSTFMPCDSGMLVLYRPEDQNNPWHIVYSFDSDESGKRIVDDRRRPLKPTAGGKLAQAVLTGKNQIIHRSEKEHQEAVLNKDGVFGNENKRSRSLVYLPLLIKNMPVGAVTVQSYQEDFFNKDRVSFLELVCADLALALDAIRYSEALAEGEAKLSVAMNIAKLGYWEYDADEDQFTFNDHFYSIFRTSADKVGGYKMSIARYIELFSHPDDAHIITEELEMALETTDPNFERQFECRIIFADGEIGHLSVHYFIVKDSQGRTIKAYGTNQDITDRKRAEESLRESEEKLNVMANATLDALIVIDDEGKIVFWNDAAGKMFGYSRDIAISKDLHKLVVPERYYGDFVRGFAKFNETGTGAIIGHTLQMSAIRSNNEEFQVEISISTMKIKEKWHAVGMVRDITEQLQAREIQARLVSQYTAMINTVPALIYIKDKELKYVEVNESFCTLIGKARGEIIGKTVYDVYPPDIAEAQRRLDLIVLNEGKSIINHEVKVSYFSDEETWISITKVPLKNDEGEIIGLVGMIQDVTEHHKSRNQLIQSDKLAAIGTLAAGVAHEINNPIGYINSNLNSMNKYLAKISQFSEMIKKHDASKWSEMQEMLSDFGDAVNESIEGANRVKKIVTDLKTFSRIDRSERALAIINDGIESTLNIVWNEIKYTCKVEKEFGNLPLLYCIPNQLNQVFLNILINAGQAISGKQGLIKIKTWSDENNIYISIEDNGMGIPEENLKRIFEPFFTTKEVGKGTGLGLSLAYDIIKKHKGHIGVESKIGVGTIFTVTLPRKGVGDNA